jgi:hypothetical protein
LAYVHYHPLAAIPAGMIVYPVAAVIAGVVGPSELRRLGKSIRRSEASSAVSTEMGADPA